MVQCSLAAGAHGLKLSHCQFCFSAIAVPVALAGPLVLMAVLLAVALAPPPPLRAGETYGIWKVKSLYTVPMLRALHLMRSAPLDTAT